MDGLTKSKINTLTRQKVSLQKKIKYVTVYYKLTQAKSEDTQRAELLSLQKGRVIAAKSMAS